MPGTRKHVGQWGARVVQADFFYFDDAAKGPPVGIAPGQLDELLTAHFVCIEDAAVADSIAVFQGKERWKVWQRR